MTDREIIENDIIVVGSGAAGLLFAIEASKNQKVLIITKGNIRESNTKYAQGGIAAVMKLNDDYERHIHDTITAGDGLCAIDAVKLLVHEAPARIRELINLGIEFDKNKDNSLIFTREGGHSSRRILHVGDLTGLVIEESLVGTVLENEKITVWENVTVIDLIVQNGVCFGVVFLHDDGRVSAVKSRAVVLATGGAGQLFAHTTNPEIATGDGIAMAHRVGANIVNMEFVQFHPTAFQKEGAPHFLISEAVRGEGGILINQRGERFMKRYHPQKDLAPRDIVSRAIFQEMLDEKSDHVFLDISFKDSEYLQARFPTIYGRCLEYGSDFTKHPIPVAPAAHYICGGIKTTIDGLTNIDGLYAIGEVACTGVHGANRLASNSLLESVVFAYRAAVHCTIQNIFGYPEDQYQTVKIEMKKFLNKQKKDFNKDLEDTIASLVDRLREQVWTYAGIRRSNKGLRIALKEIEKIEDKIDMLFKESPYTIKTIEARNLVTVAKLMLLACKRRKFNAGTHFNEDLINVERPVAVEMNSPVSFYQG